MKLPIIIPRRSGAEIQIDRQPAWAGGEWIIRRNFMWDKEWRFYQLCTVKKAPEALIANLHAKARAMKSQVG